MQPDEPVSIRFAGFLERGSGWILLTTAVLTVLLAIPMVAMRPDEDASDNPGARFRKADGVSYPRVRRAHENAREIFGLTFPFAHLRLSVLGGHIIHWMRSAEPVSERSLQALDQPAQRTLPGLVAETVEQLVYEEDLAARWYPIDKTVPIVIDPRMSAGSPTIEGRGVTIQTIRKRFKTGQKLDLFVKTPRQPGARWG